MSLPCQERAFAPVLAGAAYVPSVIRRPAGTREALNIGQLTDVSHCKLHQYLCCNHEIKYQHRSHRGWPRRVTWLSPDRLIPAW